MSQTCDVSKVRNPVQKSLFLSTSVTVLNQSKRICDCKSRAVFSVSVIVDVKFSEMIYTCVMSLSDFASSVGLLSGRGT